MARRASRSLAEQQIMAALLEAGGAPRSRRDLAGAAGPEARGGGRAVDTHVYRLRRKLAQVPAIRIETVRQRGFRLTFADDRARHATHAAPCAPCIDCGPRARSAVDCGLPAAARGAS